MSGEVWDTPTVVPVGSVVPTTYFENVRNNIAVNGRGGGRSTMASATRASSLTLPNETDAVFEVLSSGLSGQYVTFISTSGRDYGNTIKLINNGSQFYYTHNTPSTPPSGFAKIYVSNGAGISAGDKTMYEFTLYNDGTNDYWLCTV